MVSADNTNHDVLGLIFSFLGTNDLFSISLVSTSFKAAATAKLYRWIFFRLDQLKRWPRVASPFSTILSHPELGVHVRFCDIKFVPKISGQPHPLFISTCAKSLALCHNLLSFTCTNDVPTLLPLLADQKRLTELKLQASLGAEQTKALTQIHGLQSLALYRASLSICQTLPAWIPTLARTLTSLTITDSADLNETVLELLTSSLPRLHGLHILGCPRIDHQMILRLLTYTPLLDSLSFTSWANPSTFSTLYLSLPNLRHLSVDTCRSLHAVSSLYSSIFSTLAACPLTSLTLITSQRVVVGDTTITHVVNNYGETLARFNARNISLTDHSMELLCIGCCHLEQLAVVVPVKDLDTFSGSLALAQNLHTLIDVGDSPVYHRQVALTAKDVRGLFRCAPKLHTFISRRRRWTRERVPIHPQDCECHSKEYCDRQRRIDGHEIVTKLERLKLQHPMMREYCS